MLTEVEFSSDPTLIGPRQIQGFHKDWAYAFTPERIHKSLLGSEWCLYATVGSQVVGYIAVIGDGQTFAFVTSLEVLPEHRSRGIGTHLLKSAIQRFQDRYAFDLVCDESVVNFYQALDFQKVVGMCKRNYSP